MSIFIPSSEPLTVAKNVNVLSMRPKVVILSLYSSRMQLKRVKLNWLVPLVNPSVTFEATAVGVVM